MNDPVVVLLNTIEGAEYAEDAADAAGHLDEAERHYQRGVSAFEALPDTTPTTGRGAIMLLRHARQLGADFPTCDRVMGPLVLKVAVGIANGIGPADGEEMTAAIQAIANAATADGAADVTRCLAGVRTWLADACPAARDGRLAALASAPGGTGHPAGYGPSAALQIRISV